MNGTGPAAGRGRPSAREKIAHAARAIYGLLRPLLGPRACRFHPTCSEYSFQSFIKHGLFKGALLSASRIIRCHPWNPGGYDPVR
ncbi:MAG TPA: membrane protein insertion efficiency factor YidD [Elusimicrobiales bacterium]|nr:membrane protein insertion efficiency factor YidD [Elusimicrobiales bacterium]